MESVIVQLITTAGVVVVAILGNHKLNSIGADAKTSAEQTANSHQDAEFPNLREELTAVHADVREVAEIVRGHDRHFVRIDRNLDDLHRDDGQIEDTIGRESLAAARALTAAIKDRDEKFAELERTITSHIASCPPDQRTN